MTFEAARKIAPRYDIYILEQTWRLWNEAKGTTDEIRNPDAAYLAFVRKHVKENPI